MAVHPSPIHMTSTALPITSAGRFSPLGPLGIYPFLSYSHLGFDLRDCMGVDLNPLNGFEPKARQTLADNLPLDSRPR
jgi:hypothetical protein